MSPAPDADTFLRFHTDVSAEIFLEQLVVVRVNPDTFFQNVLKFFLIPRGRRERCPPSFPDLRFGSSHSLFLKRRVDRTFFCQMVFNI